MKEIQAKLIKEVERLESKIKAAAEIIAGIAERKEKVIKSYLMGNEPESLPLAAEPEGKYGNS